MISTKISKVVFLLVLSLPCFLGANQADNKPTNTFVSASKHPFWQILRQQMPQINFQMNQIESNQRLIAMDNPKSQGTFNQSTSKILFLKGKLWRQYTKTQGSLKVDSSKAYQFSPIPTNFQKLINSGNLKISIEALNDKKSGNLRFYFTSPEQQGFLEFNSQKIIQFIQIDNNASERETLAFGIHNKKLVFQSYAKTSIQKQSGQRLLETLFEKYIYQ